MTEQVAQAQYRGPRLRLHRALYQFNHKRSRAGNWEKVDKGFLKRIEHATYETRHWWQWGKAFMPLFGRADGGSYSPPEMRSWYWTWITDDTKKGGQRLLVVKSYQEKCDWDTVFKAQQKAYATWYGSLSDDERNFRTRTPEMEKALRERRPTEPYWHYFNEQDDGHTLIAGNVYEGNGGTNYGLSRPEQALLIRFLIKARLNTWFGLRTWLYYKGLHNSVHEKVPFTCQVTPDPGSGGYSHWHCHEKKGHFPATPHRYRSYAWDGQGRVEYQGDGVNV